MMEKGELTYVKCRRKTVLGPNLCDIFMWHLRKLVIYQTIRFRNLSLWWSCDVFSSLIIEFSFSFSLNICWKVCSSVKKAWAKRRHEFEGISKTKRIPINSQTHRKAGVFPHLFYAIEINSSIRLVSILALIGRCQLSLIVLCANRCFLRSPHCLEIHT